MKHTKLPWRVANIGGIYAEGRDTPVAIVQYRPKTPDECKANAAYIVHAANNYPALVEALKAQHNALDTAMAMLVNRDLDFRPSKSPMWPAVVQGKATLSACGESE